jgi:hypothetical protein
MIKLLSFMIKLQSSLCTKGMCWICLLVQLTRFATHFPFSKCVSYNTLETKPSLLHVSLDDILLPLVSACCSHF